METHSFLKLFYGPLFYQTNNINFFQYTSAGEERKMCGLSLLVDNGYLKYKQMQCPYKYWSSDKEKEWSKMAESLRLCSDIYVVHVMCQFILRIPSSCELS